MKNFTYEWKPPEEVRIVGPEACEKYIGMCTATLEIRFPQMRLCERVQQEIEAVLDAIIMDIELEKLK